MMIFLLQIPYKPRLVACEIDLRQRDLIYLPLLSPLLHPTKNSLSSNRSHSPRHPTFHLIPSIICS